MPRQGQNGDVKASWLGALSSHVIGLRLEYPTSFTIHSDLQVPVTDRGQSVTRKSPRGHTGYGTFTGGNTTFVPAQRKRAYRPRVSQLAASSLSLFPCFYTFFFNELIPIISCNIISI